MELWMRHGDEKIIKQDTMDKGHYPNRNDSVPQNGCYDQLNYVYLRFREIKEESKTQIMGPET